LEIAKMVNLKRANLAFYSPHVISGAELVLTVTAQQIAFFTKPMICITSPEPQDREVVGWWV